MISSSSNPRIKTLKSLAERKGREKEKKFAVEGIHLVREALISGSTHRKTKILEAFFSKRASKSAEGGSILKSLLKSGVVMEEVSEKVMDGISLVESPQGIVAVLSIEEDNIDDLVESKSPLVIVCDGVQDPGNVGTIIRSSDALGATGVILGGSGADLYNPKTVRASMGSIFHIPVVVFEDTKIALRRLKEKGLGLIATALSGSVEPRSADLAAACAVIFGAEGSGLGEDIVKMCGSSVKVPMKGSAESLNVGIAASIVLYEAMRQRQEKENA